MTSTTKIGATRNKRSRVWDFFSEKNSSYAQCNLCNAISNYSKSTSYMLRHLRRWHKAEFEIIKVSNVLNLRNCSVQCEKLDEPHGIDLNNPRPFINREKLNLKHTEFQLKRQKVTQTQNIEKNKMTSTTKIGTAMKKRSRVWDFFTKKNASYAQCNLCNAISNYSKSTSEMLRHLRRRHKAEFGIIKVSNLINLRNCSVGCEKLDEPHGIDLNNPRPFIKREKLSLKLYQLKLKGQKVAQTQDIEKNKMTSTTKTETRKKRSRVWDFFSEKNESYAQCNLCNVTSNYTKSTSEMLRHLRRRHKAEFGIIKVSNVLNLPNCSVGCEKLDEHHGIDLNNPRPFINRHGESTETKLSVKLKLIKNKTSQAKKLLNRLSESKDSFEDSSELVANKNDCMEMINNESEPKNMPKLQKNLTPIFEFSVPSLSTNKPSLQKTLLASSEANVPSLAKNEPSLQEALHPSSEANVPILSNNEPFLQKALHPSSEASVPSVSKNEPCLQEALHPISEASVPSLSKNEPFFQKTLNPSSEAIVPSLSKNKAKKQKSVHLTNEDLLEMLSLDMLPKRIFEGKGFQKLMLTVCPNSKLPSKRELAKNITIAVESKQTEIQQKVKRLNYIALSMDIWKHRSTEDMITLRAHFIDSSWSRVSYVLDTFNFTKNGSADAIATALKKITDGLELTEKVTAISSNGLNEHVITAAAANVWDHLDCFGTMIFISATEALNSVPEIVKMKEKIINAGNYIKTSKEATEHLLSIQQEHNLPIASFKTYKTNDWLSTYKLFKLALEQYEAINTVLCYMKLDTMCLCDEEVEVFRRIIEMLEIFKVAALELSVESFVSASKVIPLSNLLQQVVREHLDATESPHIDFLSSFRRQIEVQFKNFEANYNLSAATLLDPRFKAHGFRDDDSFEAAKERLTTETLSVLQTEKSHTKKAKTEENSLYSITLWKHFDQRVSKSGSLKTSESEANNEITRYLKEPNLERSKCPLQWWKLNEVQFPNLKILANKYLAIPATCVQSGRLFTKQRHVYKEKLDMINLEDVRSMLYLNANN